MRLAVIVVLGMSCASSGGWKPLVVHESDGDGRAIALEFPDHQNGTEVLLALFAQAKAGEATSISDLEIQVGPCARELAEQPRVLEAKRDADPQLDRIMIQAHETTYSCHKAVDQILTGGVGENGRFTLRNAEIEIRDRCEHRPIERLATRYRFEVDHGFVPPDLGEIQRWTSAALSFGVPQCGLAPKNEIRARFHTGSPSVARDTPTLGPRQTSGAASRAIIDLVRSAKAAAEAKQPAQATQLAEEALARFDEGRGWDELDNAAALELGESVAAAHFYAVELDVDRFLGREGPAEIDASWATEIGAEIDRIAKRYERIQDRVRLPAVMPWLHAGAERLAQLHRHTAVILEELGQVEASELERDKARALVADRDRR